MGSSRCRGRREILSSSPYQDLNHRESHGAAKLASLFDLVIMF